MLDFTAIDFETANSYRGSPCAVGLVRVRNGQPVDERRWLIRPPEQVDYFDGFNTVLHGIDAEMVRDAPRWDNVLPAIVDYIGDDVVVAHNAGFDIGVIRYACAVDNIEWPEMQFLCTMVMARRALSLPTYRLPFVAELLGFDMGDHHDPLADAHGVVGVVRALAEAAGVTDLADLAATHHMSIGRMSNGIYTGSVAIGTGVRNFTPIEVNTNADPDGYLYGRVVVFTGALMSMTRDIARHECARVGATPEQNTTKRTNVLVVGDINPAVLRSGSNVTGKARRAFELQDKGQAIEVMTEDDFVRCLDGKPLADIREVAQLFPEPAPDPATSTPRKRDRLRSVPLDQRPQPTPLKPPKPPRPLRRERVATDQFCSVDGCSNNAAFKTRSKPTYCDAHITVILSRGGLEALETFTRPDDWLLTRCLQCSNVGHYRFVYVLDNNAADIATCRACFWRKWAAHQRAALGPYDDPEPVPYEKAQTIAEDHGYIYLGPLTNPSLAYDPHRTECRRCGKISAERLGDISFGCTCQPRKK
ncbi:MAG TPA: exonuclease domain-containing protein [Nocardioidaceae bacterium]|nr:exonuclease domain-containing protein [Nocardioidaceae bacterium]